MNATMNGGGAGAVIIWKDYKSLQEGRDMIRAGIAKRNPSLAYPLIACAVPVGTSAMVTERPALGLRDVLITSGEFTGCRGTVNMESID